MSRMMKMIKGGRQLEEKNLFLVNCLPRIFLLKPTLSHTYLHTKILGNWNSGKLSK